MKFRVVFLVNVCFWVKNGVEGCQLYQLGEVLNRWRTLVLPIMLPGSLSFHAFPRIPLGLRSPVKHVCVCDYRISQYN